MLDLGALRSEWVMNPQRLNQHSHNYHTVDLTGLSPDSSLVQTHRNGCGCVRFENLLDSEVSAFEHAPSSGLETPGARRDGSVIEAPASKLHPWVITQHEYQVSWFCWRESSMCFLLCETLGCKAGLKSGLLASGY